MQRVQHDTLFRDFDAFLACLGRRPSPKTCAGQTRASHSGQGTASGTPYIARLD